MKTLRTLKSKKVWNITYSYERLEDAREGYARHNSKPYGSTPIGQVFEEVEELKDSNLTILKMIPQNLYTTFTTSFLCTDTFEEINRTIEEAYQYETTVNSRYKF